MVDGLMAAVDLDTASTESTCLSLANFLPVFTAVKFSNWGNSIFPILKTVSDELSHPTHIVHPTSLAAFRLSHMEVHLPV